MTHQTAIHGISIELDTEHREVMADGWHWHFAGVWSLAGTKVRGVRVMSSHAGGQIRGYVLDEHGGLRLAGPCYTGHWQEMDEEVARVLGAQVVPYQVTAGGAVTAAE